MGTRAAVLLVCLAVSVNVLPVVQAQSSVLTLLAPTTAFAGWGLRLGVVVQVPPLSSSSGFVAELETGIPLANATASASRGTCSMRSPTVASCTLGSMPSGGRVEMTVVGGTPSDPAPGAVVVATGRLLANGGSQVASQTRTIALLPRADLAATGGFTEIRRDTPVDIGVVNAGPSTARNAIVTMRLVGAPHVSFLNASYPAGCTGTNSSVTCAAGAVAPGGARSFRIGVRPEVPTPSTMSADQLPRVVVSASSSAFDPASGDSVRASPYLVTAHAAAGELYIDGSREPVLEGSPLAFRVRGVSYGDIRAQEFQFRVNVTNVSSLTTPEGCGPQHVGPDNVSTYCMLETDLGFGESRSWEFVGATTEGSGVGVRLSAINIIGPQGQGSYDMSGFIGLFYLSDAYLNSPSRFFPLAQREPAAVTTTLTGPSELHMRENASYTLDVRNEGLGRSAPFLVNLSAEGAARISSATPNVGSCVLTTGGGMSCELGPIAAGERATVNFTVAARDLGTLTLTTTTTEGNAPAPRTLAIGPESADIVFTRFETDLASVVVGEKVTVTMAARNDGPSSVHKAVIETQLPAGLEVSVDIDGPCVQVDQTITCFIGTLFPGQEKDISASVTARAPGSYTATSNARSSASDPDPSDNARSLTVEVILAA